MDMVKADNKNDYGNVIYNIDNYIQTKIDTLTEQEKYWSEDQKIKAKRIQRLIEWWDCLNTYGGHELCTEPLVQYFSPNYEEEILRQSKRR